MPSKRNKRLSRAVSTERLDVIANARIEESTVQNNMATFSPNIQTLIQTLPNFSGKKEDNINFFLKQYEELAQEISISNRLKLILLKNKLAGTAKELLINNEELNAETDYDSFCEKLLNFFQDSSSFEQSQSQFMTIKQKPDQNIDEFAKLFNNAARKYLRDSGHSDKQGAKEFLNTIKLTRFLDSIRPDIALEVRKTAPTTFELALKMAKQIEIAFNTSQKEIINVTTSNNETQTLYDTIVSLTQKHEKEMNELREQLNKQKISENTKKINMSENFCEICKRSGHLTDVCWYNSLNRQTSTFPPTQYYNKPHYNRGIPRLFQSGYRGNMQQGNFSHSNMGYNYYPNMYAQGYQAQHQQNANNYGSHVNNSQGYDKNQRGYKHQRGKQTQSRKPMITYPQEN